MWHTEPLRNIYDEPDPSINHRDVAPRSARHAWQPEQLGSSTDPYRATASEEEIADTAANPTPSVGDQDSDSNCRSGTEPAAAAHVPTLKTLCLEVISKLSTCSLQNRLAAASCLGLLHLGSLDTLQQRYAAHITESIAEAHLMLCKRFGAEVVEEAVGAEMALQLRARTDAKAKV